MTTFTSHLAMVAVACTMLLATPSRADDPDALPTPRPKAPQALKLPDDPTAAKDAELPRPAGKPGRAPDPEGAGKEGAKAGAEKEAKKDAKKEPPPPDGRCDQCGSRVCVSKQCVPKLEEKEITKVC